MVEEIVYVLCRITQVHNQIMSVGCLAFYSKKDAEAEKQTRLDLYEQATENPHNKQWYEGTVNKSQGCARTKDMSMVVTFSIHETTMK